MLLVDATQAPFRANGTVDEMAACCAFLLSTDAAYVNGVDLLVDGGRTAGT